jgi:hypothetical protein
VWDRLERIVEADDWRVLEPFLTAPAGSDVGVAVRRWYRSRRGHWTKRHEWAFSEDREGSDPDACLRLLAVALAKPEQVVTWVQKESVY